MKKRVNFKIVFILLILAFIYAPIVLLTIYSFNASNSIKTWTGFSFRHYQYFFNFQTIRCPPCFPRCFSR